MRGSKILSPAASHVLQFFFFLVLQLLVFVPQVLLIVFHGQASLWVGYGLGAQASLVAAVITLVALGLIGFKMSGQLSYAVPLSFALFPLCLGHIITLTTYFRAMGDLPYEWGTFAYAVRDLYAIPFAAITFIGITCLHVFHLRRGIA